jgi:2-polyprenyl-3-methyl-5-hydroxy-6-metoxy-1,4-benzoquinol methylase
MNQYYNEEYYKNYDPIPYENREVWMKFFSNIAENIVRDFHPTTVLDVGCAMGYLVVALRDLGVEAYGIDISDYAISRIREDCKPYCRVWSALEPIPEDFPKFFDLVTNIEVAEHLNEEDGKKLIKNICQLSDSILFSSTPDDNNEKTHFNVQKSEYWSQIFAQNGFYKKLEYNAEYISPQACCFIKEDKNKIQIIVDYERKIRLIKDSYNELKTIKDRLKESFDRDILIKEKHIEDFHKTTIEQAKQIEDQAKQIEDLLIANTILQERIEKLSSENLLWKESYKRIIKSTSWKITKPLREIKSIMKSRNNRDL